MRILVVLLSLILVVSEASATGQYFNFAPESYPGFVCDIAIGGISGTTHNILELKKNGKTTELDGKVRPRFDLVYTPTYKVKTGQPKPQVIATDLVVLGVDPGYYDLGKGQGLVLSADDRATPTGKTTQALRTRIVRETYLYGWGGTGGISINENLVIDLGETKSADDQKVTPSKVGFPRSIPTQFCKVTE